MAKSSVVYVCSECGYETSRWLGKCPGCNTFNTLVEETAVPKSKAKAALPGIMRKTKHETLASIEISRELRIPTMIDELDRVLSGGIVEGSLSLIGGEPGVGKSTLLLQICQNIGGAGETVLYVSGEESAKQIKLRADRLGVTSSNLHVLCETGMAAVESAVSELDPWLVIIDSIQTMNCEELDNSPGSVTQVRECGARMMRIAKEKGRAVVLVGHVTKEGSLAGPRVLEHMVDTVLYFEGERFGSYRIVRCVKNRFGATNEIGIFEMAGNGLSGIENPSEYMLSGRPINVPGSCVSCTVEGTRPILTEIQALVCPTSFGMPRRTSAGADFNRFVMLLAVLEKRFGLRLGDHDGYINIAGGLKITEPAADAAMAAAVASSYRNKTIAPTTVIFGEVGLAGELRAVNMAERRVSEAQKLGFKLCVLPRSNLKGLKASDGIELVGVNNVGDLLELVLN